MDGGAAGEMAQAPSGKGAGDENFPVAGAFIAPRLRAPVRAFYAFARAADDVADDPTLSPAEKLRRLDRFEAALDGGPGPEPARRLRPALAAAGVTDAHARALLVAFRRDATVARYADWAALMDYCAYSAAPVGAFLLDLHGAGPAARAPSDALCAALQVLNHLQDLRADRRALDRVYLPLDWIEGGEAGLGALDAPATGPGLRAAVDRALDGVDALLATAAALPAALPSRRLAAQSAMIAALARRLSARLRRGDPLAAPVKLDRLDFLAAALPGAWAALRRPAAPARAA